MVYLDGLIIYISAWLGAFTSDGRADAPLTLRRILVLVLFPLFLLVQLLHIACLILDHVLFPGFRATSVHRPLFILGIPRSGTTFLHRELARDEAFTAPESWEVLVAPSICQRHILSLLARVDEALGQPLARIGKSMLRRWGAAVDEVHPLGLTEAEEDYLALLPAAGCFFVMLMFPHAGGFQNLGRFDSLPTERRDRLLRCYHGLLQRQVYFHGNAQLLSKNAAFTSWVPYLAKQYDDAIFVFCIREPKAALTSQLTSLRAARDAFASFPSDQRLAQRFTEYYAAWLAQLRRTRSALPREPLVVEQEWLRGHRAETVAAIYARLERSNSCGSAELGQSAQGTSHAMPARATADWELDRRLVEAMQEDYAALKDLARSQREETVCC